MPRRPPRPAGVEEGHVTDAGADGGHRAARHGGEAALAVSSSMTAMRRNDLPAQCRGRGGVPR
jgi:hypothetical protein